LPRYEPGTELENLFENASWQMEKNIGLAAAIACIGRNIAVLAGVARRGTPSKNA
jgi:hypothetical protein